VVSRERSQNALSNKQQVTWRFGKVGCLSPTQAPSHKQQAASLTSSKLWDIIGYENIYF